MYHQFALTLEDRPPQYSSEPDLWLLRHTDETAVHGYNPALFWALSVSCSVDVLQSKFSRSTISIAVFCLQVLICLDYYFC